MNQSKKQLVRYADKHKQTQHEKRVGINTEIYFQSPSDIIIITTSSSAAAAGAKNSKDVKVLEHICP